MTNTEKYPTWLTTDQSTNENTSNTASLEKSYSLNQAQPTKRSLKVEAAQLRTILTVALLALVMAGSYLNEQLFFKELATVTAIVLLLLIVKTKSQKVT